MKKFVQELVLTLSVALFASATCSAGFAKYVDITTTYSGGDVTDFPVLVKITSATPTGFYSDVKNAGADLKFTDATGAGDYPYEIDTWNANGDSYIWVKLPKLSAGMTFRMYYGDADQTEPTNPSTAVWTGYDLVCHVSGNANDSTANNFTGMLNPDGVARSDGRVGAAYGMTEFSSKGAAIANKVYNSGGKGGSLANPNFSFSFWVRQTADTVAWKAFVGNKTAYNTTSWGFDTADTNGRLRYWSGSPTTYITVPNKLTGTGWRKIDVTHSGSEVAIYVDGVQSSKLTLAVPQRNYTDWVGWGGAASNDPFRGDSQPCDFDECRIFSTVADAARVAADYQTVANVATFLSFGDPQSGGPTVQVLPQGVIVK